MALPTITLEPSSLPIELWILILRNVQRETMINCTKVNKFFASAARPLLYQHGVFTERGLAFPFAERILPFRLLPASKAPPPEELDVVESKLKRIDIRSHPAGACHQSRDYTNVRQVQHLRVLHLTLGYHPDRDDVLCCFGDRYGLKGCLYAEALRRCSAEKLVVCNVPTFDGPPWEFEGVGRIDATMSECVMVLPGWLPSLEAPDCWETNDYRSSCGNALFRPHYPKDGVATMVFWTSHPSKQWLPPCLHQYDKRNAPQLCPRGCTQWDDFWRTVIKDFYASELKRRRRRRPDIRLRLVNAASWRPRDAKEFRVEQEAGTATPQEWNCALRDMFLRKVQQLRDLSDRWPSDDEEIYVETPSGNVQFITMQGWIKSGEWEDVFSYDEMRPWLEAIGE